MEPLKAKYTRWVFSLAYKFPWFFSGRIRFLARNYAKPESETMRELRRGGESIVVANLFHGDVKWKGVSFVAAMERKDLKKIHKWMNSQKGSPGNYHDSHEEGISSKNLVGSGTNNLGVVSFDRPDMLAVSSISVVAELPKSCYVSLLRLKNGVSYLSLYIYFDERVSKKISSVDVRAVKRYQCFQSVNPFSTRFSVIEHHDRRNLIEGLIFENARSVVSQARQAASALLEVCGVRKNISDFSTAADFFRVGSGSYFDRNAIEEIRGQESSVTVVEPFRTFLNMPISEDVSEDYIEGHVAQKIGVDGVFIKSQEESAVDNFDFYGNRYVGITEYYTFLLTLSEMYSQFNKCQEIVSPVFFRSKSSVRADLKILLNANLSLNLIEERLRAVEGGLHWGEPKYLKQIRSRIAGIRSQVTALREDVERRKGLSDGGLQLANLVWMRRYSIIVFVLVLVQIALSVLNVDWTEDGRVKNPMYLNLFSEKK